MPDFGTDLFARTAKFYAEFRPRYPQMLFEDIVRQYNLDGRGWLLDLGCGTGELVLPYAPRSSKAGKACL
ncbi:MAG TPA: hypothetical protein VFW90_03095 [Candidatus Saccharimonadales bacterium]|nr:hypothetical protein [Candidatus Saccharimonadales bacterium]